LTQHKVVGGARHSEIRAEIYETGLCRPKSFRKPPLDRDQPVPRGCGVTLAVCHNEGVAKVRELEAQLERAEHQIRLFQQISRFMVRDMSLQDVMQGIVGLLGEFLRCDSCLIYLLDNDELVLCASSTPHSSTIGKVRLRLDEGLTGWVARERRLLAISREAYKDPRFKYFRDLPEDTFEAFLSAPIVARNRVVGVVNVQHRAPHSHQGSEMELLTTVGEQIGCLLVLARLEPQVVENANHAELVLASGSGSGSASAGPFRG
jgi:signal transduction protein with GAF and PtsI domain